MHDMVENCAYKQVGRPKDRLVVETKMFFKRKVERDNEAEKYKCRLVAQGFWRVEEWNKTKKYPPHRSRQSGCIGRRQWLRTESCTILMRSKYS